MSSSIADWSQRRLAEFIADQASSAQAPTAGSGSTAQTTYIAWKSTQTASLAWNSYLSSASVTSSWHDENRTLAITKQTIAHIWITADLAQYPQNTGTSAGGSDYYSYKDCSIEIDWASPVQSQAWYPSAPSGFATFQDTASFGNAFSWHEVQYAASRFSASSYRWFQISPIVVNATPGSVIEFKRWRIRGTGQANSVDAKNVTMHLIVQNI